ncbi:glycoside hydrolase family 2 [candidate division KSB1 bacterium]|nr:glycoside hydrolase family 2 [candidate division KSB1 bacterium]RQW02385.1 MAG: glycoside hydrolase family 2 [candidate division KSB1 bacterium]
MKKSLIFLFLIAPQLFPGPRTTLLLNGVWQFEQTEDAFPPRIFSRTIPVPGLVHMAEPKIDHYDRLYAKSESAEFKTDHKVLDLQYDPKYSWYRKVIDVPQELRRQYAVLSIKKSQYITQVYVNGMDAGQSMECYTPIELPVGKFLNYGGKNEILIRVGDRGWLPSPAAGSTDKEKVNYIPGIWDDVELSFTGALRIHKALLLPSVEENQLQVKLLLRNFYEAQQVYGEQMSDTCIVRVNLVEKSTGEAFGQPVYSSAVVRRDNITPVELRLPLHKPHLWSPDDPFLYVAHIELSTVEGEAFDAVSETFGMRDFTRRGKYFYLNGERTFLRGANITLHRFFEDPDCRHLPWDRRWVTRLLAHYPKQLNWNAMRVCVGIAPDFWYDIADSVGLMLQNEWLYWQHHGWDDQIRAEYTNWVWSDGAHPSIIIWDAINENWNDYVGDQLIPELKQLDPTRIWDAGYMTGADMALDEMDEPHPYMTPGWMTNLAAHLQENPYPLGDLHWWPEQWHVQFESSAAQLINEYGWVWLWRNGAPSHLTRAFYDYYLGPDATAQERWEMQAYWLQCQTEWLRARRDLAGILAFCYLSDNLGFTGDWWMGDVAELNPSPTLQWFKHCFAPTGVYIDLRDQRYIKMGEPYEPGSSLCFNLVGVTDEQHIVNGIVRVRLLNLAGDDVWATSLVLEIRPNENKYVPVCLELPEKGGGYVLVAEFRKDMDEPVLSRRYIRVGRADKYKFLILPENEYLESPSSQRNAERE